MSLTCPSTEVALKSFFLGPQAENQPWLMATVQEMLESWCQWRRQSFPEDGRAISEEDRHREEFEQRQRKTRQLLRELDQRLRHEIPKFSPRYVGHMFSEMSLPALLGHFLTLLHNPNIISRESALVAADIENEAVLELADMLGCPGAHGHFTSGGTVANFEAVVRARARLYQWLARAAVGGATAQGYFQAAHAGWPAQVEIQELGPYLPEEVGPVQSARALEAAFGKPFPEPVLIVPAGAHYSWKKAARLLGLGERQLRFVGRDARGHYRSRHLQQLLQQCQQEDRPVLAVVSVAGTTETGAIDPVDEVQDRLDPLGAIWHHVDAAFGGFLCSLLRPDPEAPAGGMFPCPLLPRARKALESIGRATSITIDPHKLGYVPYASGTFLAADPRDYHCVKLLAPYIEYSSSLDRGPFTLEGSRSAAGAVATWLTARSLGLHQGGYGRLLARTVRQKQKLESHLLNALPDLRVAPGCDSNLLCFCLAKEGEGISLTNRNTRTYLDSLHAHGYSLSHTQFPLQPGDFAREWVGQWQAQLDEAELWVVRMTLMNPFFDSAELNGSHIEQLANLLVKLRS